MPGHLDIRLRKGRAWISARKGQVYIQLAEGKQDRHSSIPISKKEPVIVTLNVNGQAKCRSVEGTPLHLECVVGLDQKVTKHTVEPSHTIALHEGRWTITAPSLT